MGGGWWVAGGPVCVYVVGDAGLLTLGFSPVLSCPMVQELETFSLSAPQQALPTAVIWAFRDTIPACTWARGTYSPVGGPHPHPTPWNIVLGELTLLKFSHLLTVCP